MHSHTIESSLAFQIKNFLLVPLNIKMEEFYLCLLLLLLLPPPPPLSLSLSLSLCTLSISFIFISLVNSKSAHVLIADEGVFTVCSYSFKGGFTLENFFFISLDATNNLNERSSLSVCCCCWYAQKFWRATDDVPLTPDGKEESTPDWISASWDWENSQRKN